MYVIETSETKLTPAEKKVIESVLNDPTCGPTHVQSRQLRTANNLVKKGYLAKDNTFCYSGAYYTSKTSVTILNNYACFKDVHVTPKQ